MRRSVPSAPVPAPRAPQARVVEALPPRLAAELAALTTVRQINRMHVERAAGHIRIAEVELYRARRVLCRLAA